MSHQIIKQPDGKLAVFSDNVDAWILYDASPDEVVRYYEERAAKDARESAQRTVDLVLADQPRKVYYQFAMTFEEADAGAEVPLARLRAEAEALEANPG
jgi:hypothetical protein